MFVIFCVVVHLFDVCKDIHCWKWYFCLFLSVFVCGFEMKRYHWPAPSTTSEPHPQTRHNTRQFTVYTFVDGGIQLCKFFVSVMMLLCCTTTRLGQDDTKKGTIKGDICMQNAFDVSSHTECKKKVSLIIFWIHLIKFWILFRAFFRQRTSYQHTQNDDRIEMSSFSSFV